MTEHRSKIEQAVVYLASRCDGAATQDGMGFNGYDSPFGKSLARQIQEGKELTPKQASVALSIILKYSCQLAEIGIVPSDIPSPAAPPPVEKFRFIVWDGKRFLIKFNYDPPVIDAVREIPGRRWHNDEKHWSAPADKAAIDGLLELGKEFNFRWSSDAEAIRHALVIQFDQNLADSRAEDADLQVDGLGGELRPFQRAGVAYAIRNQRTFIADEMGLGKTIEALATLVKLSAFPAIVVCPATLKWNWEREVKKWIPDADVAIISGRKSKMSEWLSADIVIVNYDLIGVKRLPKGSRRDYSAPSGNDTVDALRAMRPNAVIFDESHYAKNYKAQRTEGCKVLAHGVEIRLALTGTPVLNRPSELLSQLTILDRLNDFGGFWSFFNTYCGGMGGGDFTPTRKSLTELNERMRSICYIRREKSTVMKELPAKQRTVLEVDIDNLRDYRKAESNLYGWLVEHEGQKAASASFKAEQLTAITVLKRLSARGKLAAVKKWVQNFLETDEKLVVFAHHIEIQDALIAAFPGCAHLQGKDAGEVRQQNVDRFQDDPNCKLIVCSLMAGGVGITLTAASNVVFVELGWNPGAHDQAEDRLHRIGQHDSVNAWYLNCPDTIDADIWEVIEAKRLVVDATTEGDGEKQTAMVKELMNRIVARQRKEAGWTG